MLEIAHQHRFGHFDAEAVRVGAGLQKNRLQTARDVALLELARRQVDADAQRRQPGLGPRDALLAGRAEDPFADRHDQADLFGDRDEFIRPDLAEFIAAPAQQGFDAGDAAVAQIDLRLVGERQLAALERAAQCAFEVDAPGRRLARLGREKADRRAGAAAGGVRVIEQLGRAAGIAGQQRDADLAFADDLGAVDADRVGERFHQLRRDAERVRLVGSGGRVQQHDEFTGGRREPPCPRCGSDRAAVSRAQS